MTDDNTDQWPDSIWAYQWRQFGDLETHWLDAREFPDDHGTEYIRADIHAAEVARLRAACNTARMAFAGYVSVETAILKLDDLGGDQ